MSTRKEAVSELNWLLHGAVGLVVAVAVVYIVDMVRGYLHPSVFVIACGAMAITQTFNGINAYALKRQVIAADNGGILDREVLHRRTRMVLAMSATLILIAGAAGAMTFSLLHTLPLKYLILYGSTAISGAYDFHIVAVVRSYSPDLQDEQ